MKPTSYILLAVVLATRQPLQAQYVTETDPPATTDGYETSHYEFQTSSNEPRDRLLGWCAYHGEVKKIQVSPSELPARPTRRVGQNAFRLWRTRDGKQALGTLQNVSESAIQLRLRNGQNVNLVKQSLVGADQDFVDRVERELQSAAEYEHACWRIFAKECAMAHRDRREELFLAQQEIREILAFPCVWSVESNQEQKGNTIVLAKFQVELAKLAPGSFDVAIRLVPHAEEDFGWQNVWISSTLWPISVPLACIIDKELKVASVSEEQKLGLSNQSQHRIRVIEHGAKLDGNTIYIEAKIDLGRKYQQQIKSCVVFGYRAQPSRGIRPTTILEGQPASLEEIGGWAWGHGHKCSITPQKKKGLYTLRIEESK